MMQNNDDELDEAIRDAWREVRVDEDLKSSTMRATRESRGADSIADGGARETTVPLSTTDALPPNSPALKPPFARRHRRIIGLAASILVLVIVGAGGHAVYNTPTAYASISTSSQVTLEVNRFDRVTGVHVEDGSARAEVEALNLVGKNYEDAVAALAQGSCPGAADVDVEITSDDRRQRSALVDTTRASLSHAGCTGTCNGHRYGNRDDNEDSQGRSPDEGQSHSDGHDDGQGRGQDHDRGGEQGYDHDHSGRQEGGGSGGQHRQSGSS